MTGVKGRTALVTGAGSPDGIGFATARLLLAAGARVAITSTTERIFDRLAELGADAATAFAQPADLTKADEVAGLVAAVKDRLGGIDILVNNAGMTQVGGDIPAGPLQGMTEAGWDYGIGINLKTAFLVTRAVLPDMVCAALWADRANVIRDRAGGRDSGQLGLCRRQGRNVGHDPRVSD